MKRTVVWLAGGVLVAALGSCGGDDAGDEPPTSVLDADVDVVALDIEFDQEVYTAEPGPVTFHYVNEGSIVHTLVIEGVDRDVRLEVEHHGDEATATVELAPGSYVIYCDVPGHREAGMEARLEVG
jgi:plastocyanin